MLESVFQAKLIQHFREHGSWVLNVHGDKFQISGVPDLLVINRRLNIFIELKTGGHRYEELQKLQMKRIRQAGFRAVGMRWMDGEGVYIETEEREHIKTVGRICDVWDALLDLYVPSHLKQVKDVMEGIGSQCVVRVHEDQGMIEAMVGVRGLASLYFDLQSEELIA